MINGWSVNKIDVQFPFDGAIDNNTVYGTISHDSIKKYDHDTVLDTDTFSLYDYKLEDGKLGVSGGYLKVDMDDWSGDCDEYSQSSFGNNVYLHKDGSFDLEPK